jgi:CheY-like chemotaxis protein
VSAPRILIIDDNRAHAEGLAELLNLSGFEAFTVGSGSEGIEKTESLYVDAILLDVHLPDISGYKVCRRIRSNPATANVAIIFHTGSERPARPESLADAFLTYPVSMSDISVVIRGCIARRMQQVSSPAAEIIASS